MFDVMETKLQFLWQISSDYTVKLTKFGWRCTALSSPPAGVMSIFNRDLFPVYNIDSFLELCQPIVPPALVGLAG